jgi:hypothetical protein
MAIETLRVQGLGTYTNSLPSVAELHQVLNELGLHIFRKGALLCMSDREAFLRIAGRLGEPPVFVEDIVDEGFAALLPKEPVVMEDHIEDSTVADMDVSGTESKRQSAPRQQVTLARVLDVQLLLRAVCAYGGRRR